MPNMQKLLRLCYAFRLLITLIFVNYLSVLLLCVNKMLKKLVGFVELYYLCTRICKNVIVLTA